MRSNIASSDFFFPTAGRLDDLCASTKDITPPSKPVRQITGEYSRGGTVAAMPATQTRLFAQRKLAQVDWTINPVQESFDTKPSKPARTSSSQHPQSTLLSDNGAARADRNESSSAFDSTVQCSYGINIENLPHAICFSGVQTPVISKARVPSINVFFGVESRKKKSLVDDDDDDECDSLVEARSLFIRNARHGDISDMDGDGDDDDCEKDDVNRWSHSSSSGSLDRMSSSAVSLPSKPQRRASLLQIVC